MRVIEDCLPPFPDDWTSMRRIIKVGGSLLLRDQLAAKLDAWVRLQPPAQNVAIVGGGELIDAMRRLDERFHRDAEWVHWRCVDLLGTTHDWLGDQLPGWHRRSTAEQFRELCSMEGFENHLVRVDSFYRPESGAGLPLSWDTTTDAIAGWLAIVLNADELVLLKSCEPPAWSHLDELAAAGFVDAALPRLVDRLPRLRLVNFADWTADGS
jgi:aspartokinase-like uncharacterized kinase